MTKNLGLVVEGGGVRAMYAAGVLDERAGHQVGAHCGGLHALDELAVAIIHQNKGLGADFFDKTHEIRDLFHAYRVPPLVSPASPHENGADGRALELAFYGVKVEAE